VVRDIDYGKKLSEQMIMESFVGSFPRVNDMIKSRLERASSDSAAA
jgi:hypothetical protein